MTLINSPAVLGAALLWAAAPLVHAQTVANSVESISAVPFMTGGIGQDQQAFMRKVGKAFNLRLEFSERKDNEFIVGADVLLTDAQGTVVFALGKAGPIVNLLLPDGQYRVMATYRGRTETQLATLRGDKAQDLYFHWKGGVASE
jgi:hypothetical protein